jgi:polyphosphate glucokinase
MSDLPLPDLPIPTAPTGPFTLAIDIGGTGLKASVLDSAGAMIHERVRVKTTYPLSPTAMVDRLVALVEPLPRADRTAIGFPGIVRGGLVLTAPHFVTVAGPGTAIDPGLRAAWDRFPLADRMAQRLGHPVRMANDADLQGLAVRGGVGLELVVTLGTGFGTAIFANGRLAPHMDFSHHLFRKGETYNEQLGDAARKKAGNSKWVRRVRLALDALDRLMIYDRVYVGGGNARHLPTNLGPKVTLIDPDAGITGGVALWQSADDPTNLGALPDLGIDPVTIVRDLDEGRDAR